jgi:hypothetical protein
MFDPGLTPKMKISYSLTFDYASVIIRDAIGYSIIPTDETESWRILKCSLSELFWVL